MFQDDQAGVYKKIVVSEDNSRLLGAVLVGDVDDYGNLLQMMLNALPLPSHPDTLILPAYAGAKPTLGWMPAFNRPDLLLLRRLQRRHRPGGGRGSHHAGRHPGAHQGRYRLRRLRAAHQPGAQRRAGEAGHRGQQPPLRPLPLLPSELFHLVKVEGIRVFDELLAKHGHGHGCEVCKPTVGSILASCWNDYVLSPLNIPAAGHQRHLPRQHAKGRQLLRHPAHGRR